MGSRATVSVSFLRGRNLSSWPAPIIADFSALPYASTPYHFVGQLRVSAGAVNTNFLSATSGRLLASRCYAGGRTRRPGCRATSPKYLSPALSGGAFTCNRYLLLSGHGNFEHFVVADLEFQSKLMPLKPGKWMIRVTITFDNGGPYFGNGSFWVERDETGSSYLRYEWPAFSFS